MEVFVVDTTSFFSAVHYVDTRSCCFKQLICASVVTEVFVPCPDGLLVNLYEAKEMVVDFLNKLPVWFEKNMQTGSALGPALQAAYKLLVGLSEIIFIVAVTTSVCEIIVCSDLESNGTVLFFCL